MKKKPAPKPQRQEMEVRVGATKAETEFRIPYGFPRRLIFLGHVWFFDTVAPITKDVIYQRINDNGELVHAIVTNPDA